MILNSQQIIEKNILKLGESKGKPAQIGYDLSVKKISHLRSMGKVLKDKTELTDYHPVNDSVIEGKYWGWYLSEGYYEVTFWEGCKIPNNLVGLIRQRSSMLRNGTMLHSSVFDPGFETDYIGSFISVHRPIFIEHGARIAQIYFHTCESVADENLYGGKDSQFQFDNQRDKK
jgi:deoxycytidine triphosphate deaminase